MFIILNLKFNSRIFHKLFVWIALFLISFCAIIAKKQLKVAY